MTKTVICELCPHYCKIPEGGAGDCRIRVNLDGQLRATTYGRPSAIHIDPIEKKPLYHFLPGTTILSLATAGCNLHCLNCQNWELSQRGGEEMEQLYRAPPERIVAVTLKQKCPAIAYTYSEPIVFYEYVYDTATLAHERGLYNVLVTAGYINPLPLRKLCRVLDATNTDLKAFDEHFYRTHCSAHLKPVLEALVIFREERVWLEITYLMIPTLNDDLSNIRRMATWIRDELGAETPLHFSRYFPRYRLRNLPPTPTESLERARQEALEAGLSYVYVGNLSDESVTRCPRDGTLLVRRVGLQLFENHLIEGRCPKCQQLIAGVWK